MILVSKAQAHSVELNMRSLAWKHVTTWATQHPLTHPQNLPSPKKKRKKKVDLLHIIEDSYIDIPPNIDIKVELLPDIANLRKAH